MAKCEKCGCKLGWLSDSALLGGKTFCGRCFRAMTPEERGSRTNHVCKECAHWYVDGNYDSWCDLTREYKDRDSRVCSRFVKG